MSWLMTQSAIDTVERIRRSGLAGGVTAAERTAELKIKRGNVAVISVKGPLLNEPDLALDFFGMKYTLYSEIRSQLAEAEARNSKRVDFDFDSPGGTVEGLYQTMKAIKDSPIKSRAVAGPLMASAAYMLASQTDRIEAVDELSMVGSVGVATAGLALDWYKEIANSDSPKKRPDLSTEEGQAMVREELDDIYQVLAERIAMGRNVSVDTVKKDYGQGAMMTARTALSRRMIDGISEDSKLTASGAVDNERETDMKTLEDLKASHPDLYREAVAVGEDNERRRVKRHLKLATASGDVKQAHLDIEEGAPAGEDAVTHHASVRITAAAIAARGAEAPEPVEANEAPPEANAMAQMKADLEASCPGLVWEVFE